MIEVKHVSHSFGRAARKGGPLPVLQDVNLAIRDGTFVSFLGPSGCGKTTLLRIVHGLLEPAEGEVAIDGEIVRRPKADRAMVFQELNLLPWRTALQNVELGLEIQGMGKSERRRLAAEALATVGLRRFETHYPHQLSGGMKQRVGLARALCTTPRYLLMDEPFGALDLHTRELMQADLLRLWEADRRTVLFVTHSVDEAVLLSDRVVVFTAQPARVRAVVDIRLPRPRWTSGVEVRETPAFLEYRRRLWHLLREEDGAAEADSHQPVPVGGVG